MKNDQPISAGNTMDMRAISKSYFGTRALDAVNFSCRGGEVHALVGLNGAGKSTLMKVLGGVVEPDAGSIEINGRAVSVRTPAESAACGVSMIHQEYSLINELSICRNIFLGRELTYGRTPFVDQKLMASRVVEVMDRFGIALDPFALVKDLNSGEKQIVEIVRALMSNAWLIVMDEPTSALSEQDKGKLFALIARLRSEKIGVIYISHHMPEIFSISDRVTVMRDGQVVKTGPVAELSELDIIREMTGQELKDFVKPHKQISGAPLLEVSALSKPGVFDQVSFTLRRGEILALTGLRGCGAAEIAKAIFGLDRGVTGSIRYRGAPLDLSGGPTQRVAQNMGFVSENRDKNGILGGLSVSDNIALPFLRKRARFGLLDLGRIGGVVENAIAETKVRTASAELPIKFLSGGNKQKICFARWLEDEMELLILLEPTRGIDVHAKAEIYRIIERLADRGIGVLILSYEIDEVVLLADRVLVLFQGDVVSEYGLADIDKDRLLADMAGAGRTLPHDAAHQSAPQ